MKNSISNFSAPYVRFGGRGFWRFGFGTLSIRDGFAKLELPRFSRVKGLRCGHDVYNRKDKDSGTLTSRTRFGL